MVLWRKAALVLQLAGTVSSVMKCMLIEITLEDTIYSRAKKEQLQLLISSLHEPQVIEALSAKGFNETKRSDNQAILGNTSPLSTTGSSGNSIIEDINDGDSTNSEESGDGGESTSLSSIGLRIGPSPMERANEVWSLSSSDESE